MVRLAAAVLLACWASLPAQGGAPPALQRRVICMGAELDMQIWAADRHMALQASEAGVRAVEAVDSRLSTWRQDSELAAINRSTCGAAVPVSPATARDLALAREVAAQSSWAFDPGVGPLVAAWALREGGRRPPAAELARAVVAVGAPAFEVRCDAVVRLDPHARLEEGGFGKGVGMDAACEALAASGAEGAVLDFGGQVSVWGRAGPRWIPVAHPRARERTVAWLRLDGESAATSGNGERGLCVDGLRLGHLLDPRTGLPAPDFGSVTVVCESAARADAASTGLYVLGPDATLSGAARRLSVEALVVEVHGLGAARVRATPGLRGRVLAVGSRVEFTSGSRDPNEPGASMRKGP